MSRIGKAAAVALALASGGCVSSGAFPAASLTTVELTESNYTVVATDATGTATAGYILGLSGGAGAGAWTMALARVSGEGQLYGEALRDLWERFGAEHGAVDGRSLGLVNVRYDVDALNLILYTSVTVWVRADVVEFGP